MTTWQEQAREFLSFAPMSTAERMRVIEVLAGNHRGEVVGAISGTMANIVVMRLMGGPQTESPGAFFARFAVGCRAFLATYEAELINPTLRLQDAERDRDVARAMLAAANTDLARLEAELTEARALLEAHDALLAKATEFNFGPVTVIGHPQVDQWNVRHNGDGSLYRAKGAEDFVMSRDEAVALARELEAESA